jgi:diaminohydroxyphosphoribosylaminopyrimidine deaminase/5-amino-6-(5-phosphoribosylamino)uracil reductase
MVRQFRNPEAVMQRALQLAARGIGMVEPNPAVGAVLVDDALNFIAEGYHQQFGGPHAEINALAEAVGKATGSTMFVTLEPCCHQGKTGPCTAALRQADIRRVVIATEDPAPHAKGSGIAELRAAGIDVDVGLLQNDAARLVAAFTKLVTTCMPYVHAKWAMTLDGKIASRTGASRWISSEASRNIVHGIRGRMDAVLVGSNTVRVDDPLLTARPAGPRVAQRIVIDGTAQLSLKSQLVRTIDQAPVIVATAQSAPEENVNRLTTAGVEVLRFPPAASPAGVEESPSRVDLVSLLKELGRRKLTNVLIEGGGELFGSCFDRNLIDEVHVFVAAKVIGGATATTPVQGIGLADIPQLPDLVHPEIEIVDKDVYIHGALRDRSETGAQAR